jgi:hypothetical protein
MVRELQLLLNGEQYSSVTIKHALLLIINIIYFSPSPAVIGYSVMIMRRLMIRLLFSFILLAMGAITSLAISVAGDIAHNLLSK